MANTSSRTLRLLSLLQTHRFWAGPDLAGRLEVSERTLRRDVERLRELGYPVDSVRGHRGRLPARRRRHDAPLTVEEDEAIAMVVALNGAAQLTAGPLAEASVSALSKVVQVLPPKLRRRAEALRAVTDDSPFSEAPTVHADVLATIAQATRDTERVRFTYLARGGQAAGEEVGRHVEPHRLVTVGRRWYLLAYDLDRQDWRSFRLDRLSEPTGPGPGSGRARSPGATPRHTCERACRATRPATLSAPWSTRPRRRSRTQISRWATVTAVDARSCRVRWTVDPRWAAFGLGVLEAPFTIEEAPPEVLELSWRAGSARLRRRRPAEGLRGTDGAHRPVPDSQHG